MLTIEFLEPLFQGFRDARLAEKERALLDSDIVGLFGGVQIVDTLDSRTDRWRAYTSRLAGVKRGRFSYVSKIKHLGTPHQSLDPQSRTDEVMVSPNAFVRIVGSWSVGWP